MRCVSVVGVLALLLLPAVARADDDDAAVPPLPPPQATATTTLSPTATVDTVHLRNGGLYRGRVTEIIPGDHVTILVEGGSPTRIPWAQVERVIAASTPIPPPPAGTAVAPAVATAPEAEPPMVGPKARVHITTKKNAILYRRPAGSTGWSKACTSPCDRDLPIGDTYRITGNGLPQSKEFHLETGPAGFVDLVVDPPSTGGMVIGGILAGTGGFTAWIGSLIALVGASNAGRDCSAYSDGYYYDSRSSCERERDDGPGVRDAGLVTMGVGAAVGVLGLVVFFNSATTDIDQRKGGGANDAFLRTPTFRGSTSTAEAGVPAASFPVLFTRSF
jgi:hypothetical protein